MLPFRCFRSLITAFALAGLLHAWAWGQEPQPPEPLSPETPDVSVRVLRAGLSKTETALLTLEKALAIAQEENTTVKTTEDVVNQAKARYQTRLAELLPDLEVTFLSSDFSGAIQPFGSQLLDVTRETRQPQLLFRFPVFQGGRRIFQIRSANQTVQAEKANQQATLQQILRQTALNYYDLKRRLAQITVAEQQFNETKAQLALNQARLEAGAGVRLDVLQSEAQVARAHQQWLEASQAAEVAAIRLNETLNLPAFVGVVPAEEGQQMQTLVPTDADFKALLTMARQNRPELKALAKQIQSIEEIRKVVWSAVLPEVIVQARIGGVGPSMDTIQEYDETAFSLIFNFKNLIVPALTRYKESSAQIAEFRHRLETTENTIEREVSEAYLQAYTKQAQMAAVRAELAASELALSDAVERLQAGVGRNIDVLNAETDLTQARTSLNNTIVEYNQAQVDLVTAMGLATAQSLTQGIQLP